MKCEIIVINLLQFSDKIVVTIVRLYKLSCFNIPNLYNLILPCRNQIAVKQWTNCINSFDMPGQGFFKFLPLRIIKFDNVIFCNGNISVWHGFYRM